MARLSRLFDNVRLLSCGFIQIGGIMLLIRVYFLS